jgi:hypothetical protein
MNLTNLKKAFADNGCQTLYIKILSPNDNSKNQVYLGGSFDILNILPVHEIKTEEAGDWKRERFKASLNYYWLDENGGLSEAANSQLILYPKYPEVRFSGFLKGCYNAPSELMSRRLEGRVLVLSVGKYGKVLGYVAHPESEIATEISSMSNLEIHGVFMVLNLNDRDDSRKSLLAELYRIHKLNWIVSKRLNHDGQILPCNSSNCGGYTLEAELGITPNGYSEPDYKGWEIKQFGVINFDRFNSSVITLMTPEPTGGVYKSEGPEVFIKRFGYPDKNGRPDRMNFGGIHRVGEIHPTTQLKLVLSGYDIESGKIRNSTGQIMLLNESGIIAASWDYSSLLLHWNRKHNKACYVPSLSVKEGEQQYKFGNRVILGTGTDFQLFLSQMAKGVIYYDPGIKVENMSYRPRVKRRSQFRIKSGSLADLYKKSEIITLTEQQL